MLPDFVNGADVRMIQRRCGAGFPTETLERLRVSGKVLGQEFQGHKASQRSVLCFVNDAHAATTEFFEDAVVGDGLAN
jgi:hypothetical protein